MTVSPAASLPAKLVLLLVVFPLVLALAGGWQGYRASTASGDIEKRLSIVDGGLEMVRSNFALIESARQLSDHPGAMLPVATGGAMLISEALRQTIEAGERLARERDALLSRDWRQRVLCFPLALGVMACGIAGACTGAYGLVTVRRSGKRARLSRDVLLREFQEGLRKLPWLIGAIGLCIALALAFGIVFELANFLNAGPKGKGVDKLAVLGVMLAGGLFFFGGRLVWNIYSASKAVLEGVPLRLMGQCVGRDDAPLLWDFVRSIAEKTGAAMPDAIVIGLDEGFFVTEHPVELSGGAPFPSGRVLYLPLPYMIYMTKAEAGAVIGHELGHFTGADTEYSLLFAPIYAAAVNSLRAVDAAADTNSLVAGFAAKPAMMLGVYYLDSFDLAVRHWSREREFAADATGASIAGNEALANSLLRISVLAPPVLQALDECWHKGGKLEGGVLHRVRQIVREEGLGDPAEHLEETQAHPTDSHPPTSQRLAAVNVPVTEELLARARDSAESTLLQDLGLEVRLAEDLGETAQPCVRTGVSAALEAEFSQAARQSSDKVEEDLRGAAAFGTERVLFYENPKWGPGGLAIGAGMFCMGLLAAQKNLLAGFGGIAMGLLGMGMVPYYHKRSRSPFVILSGEGVLVGNAEREIPWTAVHDYGITRQGYSILIDLDIVEGYVPPETSDRRATFNPEARRLRVSVREIAKPYTLESFAEEFHCHWRGGIARAYLAKNGTG